MNEFATEELGYEVEILGINWNRDNPVFNEVATNGVDMPWLQDTFAENVQGHWQAVYRDVMILDPLNRKVGEAFNLTANNLGNPVTREILEERIRMAAEFMDADQDGVGDDWEERFLGNLDETADSDSDGDQADLFLEYALGTRPDSGSDLPLLKPRQVTDGELRYLSLSFQRRLGVAGGLHYAIQRRDNSGDWVDDTSSFTLLSRTSFFDGRGMEEVTYRKPHSGETSGIYRIIARNVNE